MPIGIPIALRDGRSLGGYAGLQGPCRSDPPSDLVWGRTGRLEAALATDKTDIVPVAAREWLNSTFHFRVRSPGVLFPGADIPRVRLARPRTGLRPAEMEIEKWRAETGA